MGSGSEPASGWDRGRDRAGWDRALAAVLARPGGGCRDGSGLPGPHRPPRAASSRRQSPGEPPSCTTPSAPARSPCQRGTSTPRRQSPSASSCPAWRSCCPGSPTAMTNSTSPLCRWRSASPRSTARGPGRWCAMTCAAGTWRTGSSRSGRTGIGCARRSWRAGRRRSAPWASSWPASRLAGQPGEHTERGGGEEPAPLPAAPDSAGARHCARRAGDLV
ncbi:endo-beta-N-acetylglucosaminidase [Columba livia]|uniref:Endo-beta-N-acetylglucosaminidase n=1 Tax=Columba livia TaxID=8932 RepID=A0A2I0LIP3_COLLI|nr:endo-beta-N-acetylglucosaminidase [Columba livia]